MAEVWKLCIAEVTFSQGQPTRYFDVLISCFWRQQVLAHASAWQLTKYNRVILLEDNMLIVENIDDLFFCTGVCAGRYPTICSMLFLLYFSALVLLFDLNICEVSTSTLSICISINIRAFGIAVAVSFSPSELNVKVGRLNHGQCFLQLVPTAVL